MSTFNLYFCKNRTFEGEYTSLTDLQECTKFVRYYRFHRTDIYYLHVTRPTYVENEFLGDLYHLDMKDIKVFAVSEDVALFVSVLRF